MTILYLAFDEVLRRLGTFFIADRAYVFELEGAPRGEHARVVQRSGRDP